MPFLKTLTPNMKRGAVAFAVVSGLGAWVGFRQYQASATPPPPEEPSTLAEQVVLPDAAVAAEQAVKTTAQIIFTTVPSVHATVSWGKKKLGRIEPGKPLVVVRPRDTGPLDVIIRADGYLPVHTRAHTFSDNRLSVKLTRPDQKTTLLGYRVPIDAGIAPTADDSLGEVPGSAPELLP